jgi:hypothetical protein
MNKAYRTNPKAVASAVLAWPGWIATVVRYVWLPASSTWSDANYDASTVVLFMSKKHDDEFGAKSNYGRSLENGGNLPEQEVKPEVE